MGTKKIYVSGRIFDISGDYNVKSGNRIIYDGSTGGTNPPPIDPPVIPPPTATTVGLDWSDVEVEVWKERVGLIPGTPMFKSDHDVFTNSPGLYDRYIYPGAQTALSNYSANYFGNIYPGVIGRYSLTPTEFLAYEPRPEVRCDQVLAYAAFMYLVTGTEAYALAVRNGIMYYVNRPAYNWADTNKYPLGNLSIADLNPGFMMMEWCTKLLYAYDRCKNSTSFSTNDKEAIQTWFTRAAEYSYNVVTYGFNLYIPGRLVNDYSVIKNRDRQITTLWTGGPAVYEISLTVNNRRIHWIELMFMVGIKFGLNKYINEGIRCFKEVIAHCTMLSDSHNTELYRSTETEPERGYGYIGIMCAKMMNMADTYARFYDNSLFEYTFTQEELDIFLPSNHSIKPWYADLAITGKSVYKMCYSYLKLIDGSFGNTIQRANENIDGYTLLGTPINKNSDHNMCRGNMYYQDQDWQDIYMRRKPGQRSHLYTPSPAGSFYPWFGLLCTNPGTWLQWGLMEGEVWPYANVKT